MSITVVRPTNSVEIITDLVALQASLNEANALQEFESNLPQTHDSEVKAKQNRSLQAKKTKLKKIVEKVNESTIVLNLRGLNSSRWNMIALEHSQASGERVIRDWPKMIAEALPEMLEKATWKTKDETISFTQEELSELLESLSDTQTMDIITVIQELNTPVATVPKGILDLI